MSGSQPHSGLATIQRNFTPNVVKSEPTPTPTASQAQKKSKISAAMRAAISQGIASRGDNPPPPSTGMKRPSSGVEPPAKRHLPSTWNENHPRASASSYTSSSNTSSQAAALSTTNGTTRKAAPVKQDIGDIAAEAPRVVAANSTKNKGPAKIFLSAEQRYVLDLVEKGESVFYTGSAGTGKSVLLREIIKVLQKKYPSADGVAITASTGIAACNIGGITVHSYAGIGLGTDDAEDLVKRIRKNRKTSGRWLRTKVLIIDERMLIYCSRSSV
ncbi:hypothetical protein PENSPDRAFT_194211 [Peniophora sp. CONT]|nr:hypothetical protein PENSPDRAFT_194211 [Peniophora sp. CONT]